MSTVTKLDIVDTNVLYARDASIGIASIQNLAFDTSYLTGSVEVNGTLTVNDDLNVLSGNIVQTGPDPNIFGSTVMQNVECQNLTVNGTQNFTNLSVNGNLTVTGDLAQSSGDAIISNLIATNCLVNGPAQFSDSLVADSLNIASSITVGASSTMNGLNASNIYVTNSAEFNEAVLNGSVTATSQVSLTGPINQTLTSPANVLGSTNIIGSLSCDSLSSTSLSCSSLSTGDLTITGSLNTTGSLTASGSITAATGSIGSLSCNQITGSCTIDFLTCSNGISASSAVLGNTILNENSSLTLNSASIQQTGASGTNILRDTIVSGILQVQGGNLNVGNKIVFPDGTEQTTAASSSSLGKVTWIENLDGVLVSSASPIPIVGPLTISGGSTGKYFIVRVDTIQQSDTNNVTTAEYGIYINSSIYPDASFLDSSPGNGFSSASFSRAYYLLPNVTYALELKANTIGGLAYSTKPGTKITAQEVGPITIL